MTNDKLQELARKHLWMHFTDMGYYQKNDIPIMSHGEGCYIYDINGKKYLDGLAGLFTSQLFCGSNRKRPPLAPPRLSDPLKVDAEAQAVLTI